MKCLIVQPVHADGLALLRANGVEAVLCPDPTDASVVPRIGDCDAVITRDAGLSAAAIGAGKVLRVVVVHGAGHDAVDKEAATRHGVLVCNTPGANARSVVEMALGLALAAARRIPAGDRAVRAGQHGFREAFPTFELYGKTALIVGWGTIGAGLGRILREAFGMRVLIYSPRAPHVEGFLRVADLTQGLAEADLISLHTPLHAQTQGLIGTAALAACKPGAILVNTARAGLIDEAALAAAVDSGRIAAAALDVYTPGAPQGPLGAFAQVIFSPHQGGATREALSRVALGSVRHVLSALAGQIPDTALNSPPGWPRRFT